MLKIELQVKRDLFIYYPDAKFDNLGYTLRKYLLLFIYLIFKIIIFIIIVIIFKLKKKKKRTSDFVQHIVLNFCST